LSPSALSPAAQKFLLMLPASPHYRYEIISGKNGFAMS
jgi:hypothetical protein